MGSFRHRPVCLQADISDRSVCELEARPSSHLYRCVHPRLEQIQGLCISPIRTDRPMPTAGSEATSDPLCPSSPSLDSPTLVSSTPRPIHRLPTTPTNSGGLVDSRDNTSPPTSPTSWVASVNRGYQEAGISEQAREILLAAWRKNTSSAYASAWAKWHSWCTQRVNSNPLSPSLSDILDFFTSQFQNGREYRSINVYRSALSAVLPPIEGHKVGSHPLVCQMLKGVYQLRPPQPRYSLTWEVSRMVQFVKSLGPNKGLSIKLLSYKLLGLLALTCPDRASGLAARDLRFKRVLPEGVQFKLAELTKNVKLGQDPKSCFHASFPDDKNLCVCECLKVYEDRTKDWRIHDKTKPNKLFLSYIEPHKPVTSATLARWMRELMHLSGIDTTMFKGHSVRGAVTTEASKQGFSISDIMQFADWSQENTFIKFYYRPHFDASTGRAILSSASQV